MKHDITLTYPNVPGAPFTKMESLPSRISKSTHCKIWDEITYPFPNFNAAIVGISEWISSFIPHFTWHMMIYPCWNHNEAVVIEVALQGISILTGTWSCDVLSDIESSPYSFTRTINILIKYRSRSRVYPWWMIVLLCATVSHDVWECHELCKEYWCRSGTKNL